MQARPPAEWIMRLEEELGRRSAIAAVGQALGYVVFRGFVLGRTGPVPVVVEVAGTGVLVTMSARVAFYALQRRWPPVACTRRRWRATLRVMFCAGAIAWGTLTAAILQTSGLSYPSFLALLIIISIAALTAQNIALDLFLARTFAALILMPPTVVAFAGRSGARGAVRAAPRAHEPHGGADGRDHRRAP